MKSLCKRDYFGLLIAICLLVIWSVVFADARPHVCDFTKNQSVPVEIGINYPANGSSFFSAHPHQ